MIIPDLLIAIGIFVLKAGFALEWLTCCHEQRDGCRHDGRTSRSGCSRRRPRDEGHPFENGVLKTKSGASIYATMEESMSAKDKRSAKCM